jgi:hypothetical protein
MFNVKDTEYGAKGDGVTDDRLSIQEAIDACAAVGGGDVFVPAGTYRLTGTQNSLGRPYCLELKDRVRLIGESRAASILKQAENLGGSVRLVYIQSDECTLKDLTLDGNKAQQSINKQRHGIFVEKVNQLLGEEKEKKVNWLLVENVKSQNFTGDGFYVSSNVNQVVFSNVIATANDRNGVTLAGGGNISNIKIINSAFIDNAKQQIDSEPDESPQVIPSENSLGQVNNVTISGCIVDSGNSNDYAVTCAGSSREDKNRSHGWTITGNIIKGSIIVVWCDDVCITGNIIDNPSKLPCVEIKRTAKNIVVTGNRLKLSQTSTSNVSAIFIAGAKTFDTPSLVSIANNTISVSDPRCFSVRAQGAESVSIMGNQIDGGVIRVRATALGSAVFRSAMIIGNTIANVRLSETNSNGAAIVCTGQKDPPAAGRFSIVDISHNVIINTTTDDPLASLKQGIYFDNDSLFDDEIIIDGKKLNEDIQITMIGNHIHSGNAPLTNFPSVPFLTGGNRGAGAVFTKKP